MLAMWAAIMRLMTNSQELRSCFGNRPKSHRLVVCLRSLLLLQILHAKCEITFCNHCLRIHVADGSNVFGFLMWIPGIAHSTGGDGGEGACDTLVRSYFNRWKAGWSTFTAISFNVHEKADIDGVESLHFLLLATNLSPW